MQLDLWICVALAAAAVAVKALPVKTNSTELTSNSAANYYQLAPGSNFINLQFSGYQQTESYTCGPASAMTVLHHYGLLSDAEMTHDTEMKFADAMGTSPTKGTDEVQLANFLRDLDVFSKVRRAAVLQRWFHGHFAPTMAYYQGSEDPLDGKDSIFFADSAAHFVNVDGGVTGLNARWFLGTWVSGGGVPGIMITPYI